MASGFSAYMLGVGATSMAAAVTHMQSHSGDPGSSGTSNINSGPGRVVAGLTSSGANMSLNSTVSFTGGTASAAAGWVSLWDAASAGHWLGNAQVTSGDTTFNAAGDLNITALAVTGP